MRRGVSTAISKSLARGRPRADEQGKRWRIPAAEIENAVLVALGSFLDAAVHGIHIVARIHPAHDGQTMLMGDTVLFEDEVNPVMTAALDAGLEVTALHFFFDDPKVYLALSR